MRLPRRAALFAASCAAFASLCGFAAPAQAQAYPSRTITLIVPYSAGGAMDVLARAVGKRLGEELGQPVVVDNRTGANGLIGVTAVARAKPDGYTLLMGNTTPNSIMPLISKEVTYDPLKDFETLAIVSYSPMLMVVNAESPIQTLDDLVKMGKGAGKAVNFGTLGVGATSHLVASQLKATTGANFVYVPYRGEANTIMALLAREVDVAVVTGTSVSAHVKSGKLRAIANLGSSRSSLYPDVPTLAEAGVKNLKVDLWFGFMGPAGMPPAVVAQLERSFKQIAAEPEMKTRFEQLQMTSAPTGSREFRTLLRDELEQYGRAVKALRASGELE